MYVELYVSCVQLEMAIRWHNMGSNAFKQARFVSKII